MALEAQVSVREVEAAALGRGLGVCRYARNLGTLGMEGQRRLLEAKVSVLGLGGLGGYVVEELGRMGVGRIVGIDPEVFEESNLNRQLLSEQGKLEMKKVDAAADRLARVNGAVEFVGHAMRLEEVADEVWQVDVVFDCLDNAASRVVLGGKCAAAGVPLVHGAIGGWWGEVGVIWPGSEVLEQVYGARKGGGLEVQEGTPAFTAGVAGSMMVARGVKVLTGMEVGKENRVVFFDLKADESETVTLG